MNFLSITNTSNIFTRFSLFHYIWIGICVFLCLIIFLRRRTIRRNFTGRWYYIILAFFAFLFETIYIVWAFSVSEEGNILYAIPFDFTFMAMVLSVLWFFTRKQFFFDMFYFMSFFSIFNIIFPEFGGYGVTHFRFYQFFICNIFVVFSLVYFLFVDYSNIRDIKGYLHYLMFSVCLVVFNFLLTVAGETDYLKTMMGYLSERVYSLVPSHINMIIFIVICAISGIIEYVPWYLFNKEKAEVHIEQG